jgi:hypothetical protein
MINDFNIEVIRIIKPNRKAMLSSLFLCFLDKQMRKSYEREKMNYFKRVMPVIAFTAFLLFASLEVLYRLLEMGQVDAMNSLVNGSCVALLILLAILVRCWYGFCCLVNPVLTCFALYFIAELDYDGVNVSIYYSVVVGITISFFFLVYFNEIWLVSTVIYAPSWAILCGKLAETCLWLESTKKIKLS